MVAPRIAPRLLALAVLGVAASLVLAGRPHPHPAASPAAMPEQLGLWMGQPLPVEERAKAMLETDDVAVMEYRLGKDAPVWLARVAGFGNRASFHPPELCLVGSQFELVNRGPLTVFANGRTHRVMRLVTSQKGRRFESWYWFSVGGRTTPSYYEQQLWLLVQAIRRSPRTGTLVRISTPLDTPDATRRRLLAFLTSYTADGMPTAQPLPRHGL